MFVRCTSSISGPHGFTFKRKEKVLHGAMVREICILYCNRSMAEYVKSNSKLNMLFAQKKT
jgi:hypothetical protein